MIINPNSHPPIEWTTLPVPFEEMLWAPITIHLSDNGQTFLGNVWIDRHPTDDKKFSVVLNVTDLATDDPWVHERLRIPLTSEGAKRVRVLPVAGPGIHFDLVASTQELPALSDRIQLAAAA